MKSTKRILIQTTGIFACWLMFAGCNKGNDNPGDNIVNDPTLYMVLGEEVQIAASSPGASSTWESDHPEVATVSSTGLVRAIGEGECNISEKSIGETRIIPVSVQELTVRLSESRLQLIPDGTFTLEASVLPDGYNKSGKLTFLWKSSDTDVVTVDGNGNVEAINSGQATITVSIQQFPFLKTDITVDVALVLFVKEEKQIKVDAGLVYTWESTDPSVATVSSKGLVSGVGDGGCTIRVFRNGVLYQEIPVIVNTVTLSASMNNLTAFPSPTDPVRLKAATQPAEFAKGVAWEYIWESSDANIATVDEHGRVQGVRAGNAIITVSLRQIPSLKTDIQVRVPDATYVVGINSRYPFTKGDHLFDNYYNADRWTSVTSGTQGYYVYDDDPASNNGNGNGFLCMALSGDWAQSPPAAGEKLYRTPQYAVGNSYYFVATIEESYWADGSAAYIVVASSYFLPNVNVLGNSATYSYAPLPSGVQKGEPRQVFIEYTVPEGNGIHSAGFITDFKPSQGETHFIRFRNVDLWKKN